MVEVTEVRMEDGDDATFLVGQFQCRTRLLECGKDAFKSDAFKDAFDVGEGGEVAWKAKKKGREREKRKKIILPLIAGGTPWSWSLRERNNGFPLLCTCLLNFGDLGV